MHKQWHVLCCQYCCLRTAQHRHGRCCCWALNEQLLVPLAMLSCCRHPDGHVEFVEVKSTAQVESQQFYISLRELETAAKYGQAFTVVRVFGCPVYSLRPQQVKDKVALVPGTLRHTINPQQRQTAAAQGVESRRFKRSGRPASAPNGRHQHTKLLFLQDPVQLLRRQVVKLLMEV